MLSPRNPSFYSTGYHLARNICTTVNIANGNAATFITTGSNTNITTSLHREIKIMDLGQQRVDLEKLEQQWNLDEHQPMNLERQPEQHSYFEPETATEDGDDEIEKTPRALRVHLINRGCQVCPISPLPPT